MRASDRFSQLSAPNTVKQDSVHRLMSNDPVWVNAAATSAFNICTVQTQIFGKFCFPLVPVMMSPTYKAMKKSLD